MYVDRFGQEPSPELGVTYACMHAVWKTRREDAEIAEQQTGRQHGRVIKRARRQAGSKDARGQVEGTTGAGRQEGKVESLSPPMSPIDSALGALTLRLVRGGEPSGVAETSECGCSANVVGGQGWLGSVYGDQAKCCGTL